MGFGSKYIASDIYRPFVVSNYAECNPMAMIWKLMMSPIALFMYRLVSLHKIYNRRK